MLVCTAHGCRGSHGGVSGVHHPVNLHGDVWGKARMERAVLAAGQPSLRIRGSPVVQDEGELPLNTSMKTPTC